MASPHPSAAASAVPSGLGFDAIPTPMAVVSRDLMIEEANAAFAELMQAPAASLIHEQLAGRLRTPATTCPSPAATARWSGRADGPG